MLDLFGGSGTALIAAERAGRRARIMELDPKYADVIVRRFEAVTGKAAVEAASGESFRSLSFSRPQEARSGPPVRARTLAQPS